jgi:hypothetical protein
MKIDLKETIVERGVMDCIYLDQESHKTLVHFLVQ